MVIQQKSALKNALFSVLLICVVWCFPVSVFAEPFDLEQYNSYIELQQAKNNDRYSFIENTQNKVNEFIAIVVDIGFDLFTFLFMLSVISLAAAITLRNGQWIKWGWGTMMGTIIAIIAFRIAPILVLTADQDSITLIIEEIVVFLSTVGFHMTFFMFLISLFLQSLDKIFEHPKYFKWGRGLLLGSIATMILSIVSPIIIGNL